jgi:uncharacterized protein
MKVCNNTRKTVLAEKIVEPKTLWEQSLGLLKYKTPTALLLKTRFGIHTFGMKYTIDILILDKQNCVAVMKKNLKPNRIFIWNIIYETVLELPEDTIQKTKTEIGDIISFLPLHEWDR